LLPGHEKKKKSFASSSFDHWQTHVNAEVERFSATYENIWLAGHSMGGLLAINAAVKYSRHVRGIFLMACPFKIRTFSLYVMKVRVKQAFSRNDNPIKAAYLSNSSVKLSPSLIWRIVRPAAEVRKLMLAAKGNLPQVCIPVTAVYSTADELTSIDSLEILKSETNRTLIKQVLLTDSLHAYYPEQARVIIEHELLCMIGQNY
jgi:carboxylesterase